MPETPGSAPSADLTLPRLTLRRRVAALGLVGALMVALPLVQVLRYQATEIHSLFTQKSGLEPVANAVGTQRGLLEHRMLSHQVLRGATDREPERKLRQAEVDRRLSLLASALQGGSWQRAESETTALREDWAVLVRQVIAHTIGAAESDQQHRLLVEQVLQVIDFVSDGEPVEVGNGAPVSSTVLATALALPRVAARLDELAAAKSDRNTPAYDRALAETEAALARTLGALDRALDAAQDGEQERPAAAKGLPLRALAQASAAAGARAEQCFGLLHASDATADPTAATAAATAALQAQWALFELAQGSVQDELTHRIDTLQGQRNGLLLAVAALGLAALALLASLWRGLRDAAVVPPEPLPPAATLPATPNGSRAEAGRVLQRMRAQGPSTLGKAEDRAHGEHQPTIPPEA